MGRGAVLSLKITGDAAGATRAVDETESRLGGFGKSLGKLAALGGAAFAVDKVVDFGKEAFDAASNLEQMAGSVDAVFGKSAGQIDALAAKAHAAVGLSTADYDQMAAVIGSQLKNAGVPMDQLVGKTSDLIQKGADMSAVFGGSAADAVDALSSALRGEMDPIERYGVSLNQNALNAQMAADGAKKVNGQYTQQAKAAAVLELVTKQTAQTQGQFAAQSGTAAEKSQQLSAWFDNLKAKIGGGLLPIFSALATFFTDKVSPALDTLFRKGGPVADIFAKVGDFATKQLLPALSSLWKFVQDKVIPIWEKIGHTITTVAVPAFKVIWSFVKDYAVPIFKSVLGPVLDGVKKFWDHLSTAIEKNKGKFQDIYEKIKPFLDFVKNKVAPFIGGAFSLAFDALGAAIGPVVDTISWILDKAGAVLGFIGKVGSFIFGGGSSGGGSGGATRGAGRLLGATSGGGLFASAGSLGGGGTGPAPAAAGFGIAPTVINITVQGAVDPMSTARQIQQLLDRYATRTGARLAVSR